MIKLLMVLVLGVIPPAQTKEVKYTTQVTIKYSDGDTVTAWYLHSTDGYRLGADKERYKKYGKGGKYTSPWWERDDCY